jgi:hypothetical protein
MMCQVHAPIADAGYESSRELKREKVTINTHAEHERSRFTQQYFVFFLPPWNRTASCRPGSRTTLYEHLESVLQRHHVAVLGTAHLKIAGLDLEWPSSLGLLVAELEAEPEVAGVAGHTAEGVHGSVGVGFAVCFEPLFWWIH